MIDDVPGQTAATELVPSMTQGIDAFLNGASIRRGYETQVVAAALCLMHRRMFGSLCCWCLDRLDPGHELDCARTHRGGECDRCPYVGIDTLVVDLGRDFEAITSGAG